MQAMPPLDVHNVAVIALLFFTFVLPHATCSSQPYTGTAIDAGQKNCYTVSNQSTTFTSCLPDVMVVGHAKCGTSALFALLAAHPDVLSTNPKEHCMRSSEDVAGFLQPLLNASTIGDKRFVSRCIVWPWNEKMFVALRPCHPIRLVYVVRDYADALWSAFNYWCIDKFDFDCFPGRHTGQGDYRSPELFHELIVAQNRTAIAIDPHYFPNPLLNGRPYTNHMKFYYGMVGRDNMLVVESDQLQRDPHNVWRKIAAFTGLPREHPGLRQFQSRRYNAQNKYEDRGAEVFKKSTDHNPGLYAASGFRPMLDQTRRLINRAWFNECSALNAQYGLLLACEKDEGGSR